MFGHRPPQSHPGQRGCGLDTRLASLQIRAVPALSTWGVKKHILYNANGEYSEEILANFSAILLGLTPATIQLITSYTNQLLKDGILTRILNLLDQITVSGELASLSKGRAVGHSHHKRQLVELIEEQRSCLADCLFLWAVQTPFGKDETIQILTHVKKMKLNGEESGSDDGDSGGQSSTPTLPAVDKVTVDMVTVSLCMTVMACFNIGEGFDEGNEESSLGDHYPLLADISFLPAVHNELVNVSRTL